MVTQGHVVLGNLTLHHEPKLRTALHRATLGMGLQRPIRGQGYGKKLLQEALNWAKSQPSLSWIDLGVFEHNTRAFNLYKKMGFQEIGMTKDLFRVNGFSLNDIHMVYSLR